MDSLWIFISFILAVGIPLEADAGCAQDLQNNQDFQTCFIGFSMYMSQEMQKMDPNDPTAITNVLCSKTGREKVKCAVSYIKTCPDLMTSGDTKTLFQSLQQLEGMGGLDKMCDILSGGIPQDPQDPCQAVTQCVAQKGRLLKSSPPPNGPTPFSAFQYYVSYMCGPLKGMLECFKDGDDQCSGSLESSIEMEFKKMGPDAPTYQKMKMFIMEECPKLPADFASNTCVRNSLGSDNFVTCFQQISEKYPTTDNQASCEQYRAGHKCVSMNVGEKCGNQYTKALEKLTPMFMSGIPSNCKLEASDTTGASAQTRMSALAMIIALLVALNLK